MTVALLPPISYGNTGAIEALKVGPSFVRNRGSLWHRPRSAARYPANHHIPERICWRLWCGQTASSAHSITRERPPTDAPVCATCEGRAIGSGQLPSDTDYATQYTPRWVDPPTTCPGSRTGMYVQTGQSWRVGRCLVCGELQPVRAMGGIYNSRAAIVAHPPGPGLVGRCDFHGWLRLTVHNGGAVCFCEVPE